MIAGEVVNGAVQPRQDRNRPVDSCPAVLFVDQSGELGGAELSLLDVAAHWPGRRCVRLFADGPFLGQLRARGVDAAVLRANGGLAGFKRESGFFDMLKAVPTLFKTVKALIDEVKPYDLLYANTQKAFVACAFASIFSQRPCVWHLRDILDAQHFSRPARESVVRLANRYATRIIANSQATADAFVAAGGNRERVRVVYNGLDPAPFEIRDDAARAALRGKLGCGNAPLIGVFSRLARWKGQHVVLEALSALPGVHVLFVGGSLFGSHDYATELKKRAAQPDLAGRAHFIGFSEDVPTLLHAVDFAVHSSVAPEPFGRVVVEGMLSCKPVVSVRAGGGVELIEDGVDGWLVPPGDAAALAAVLKHLIEHPDEAASLAARGRERARRDFNIPKMIEGVRSVLSELA